MSTRITKTKMKKYKRLLRQAVYALLVFVGFVLIWQGVAWTGLFHSTLLPAPLDVVYALSELFRSGELAEHVAVSVLRVLGGFFLAAFFAVPLGIVLGWYKQVGTAFYPFIQVVRTISPIAWIPLAILWFGIGDKPAIFIIFITSFFPILVATMHAQRHINPAIIKTAINFGAKGTYLLFKVILPASFPFVMVGLRIALGIAWVIVVAAEMVGMRSGLGFMILDARNFLRTDMVIAGMIVIGIIGLVLDKVMWSIEKRVEKHKNRAENIFTWDEEPL